MREKEPRKEDRRVRRTRKMLTQALTCLLEKKQINEITVKELTDLADINRGTFYLYYKDVFDMLNRIEDDLLNDLEQIIESTPVEGEVIVPLEMLTGVFEFAEENQEMCRVLLSENGDMNFLHRLYAVLRERFHSVYAGIKDRNEWEIDYLYSFLVFGCAGIIREWVNGGCRVNHQKMAEMTESMIHLGDR